MSHADEARAAQRQLARHKGEKVEAAASLDWKPDLLERHLALLTCTRPSCRRGRDGASNSAMRSCWPGL